MSYTQSSVNRNTVVGKELALLGGVLVTIAALFGFVYALTHLDNLAGNVIQLGISVWVVGTIVQFWAAESWREGLTLKELGLAVLWPLGMYKAIRAGSVRQGVSGFSTNVPKSTDNSPDLLPETLALIVGAFVTLCGLPFFFASVYGVFDIIGDLIGLLIASYFVGLAFEFWSARLYKSGLTVGEILGLLVWPVDIVKKIARGTRRQKTGAPSSVTV